VTFLGQGVWDRKDFNSCNSSNFKRKAGRVKTLIPGIKVFAAPDPALKKVINFIRRRRRKASCLCSSSADASDNAAMHFK